MEDPGVRQEIPSARLHGSGRGFAEEVVGEAAKERKYFWPASAADGCNTDGLALCAMWDGAANAECRTWTVPQVRLRVALLQAMHLLRSCQPLRVHADHYRESSPQRHEEQLRFLLHASDGGKGDFQQRRPGRRRAEGIREFIQEIAPAAVAWLVEDRVQPTYHRA